jgi:hypothetical protein
MNILSGAKMKKLFLLLCLIPTLASASGKFHITGNYFTKDGKAFPATGVSVYEPLFLGLNYDGFIGFGVAPRHNWPDVYWMTLRNDLSLALTKNISLSVGATIRLSDQEWIGLEDESNVHCKLVVQLWE